MDDGYLGLTLLGRSGDVRECWRHGKMFQTMRLLSTARPTTANQLVWRFLGDGNRNREKRVEVLQIKRER